jgi:hypothetical protein
MSRQCLSVWEVYTRNESVQINIQYSVCVAWSLVCNLLLSDFKWLVYLTSSLH